MLYSLITPYKGHFPMAFYLSAALTCGLLGAGSTVYADLPWLTLVLFALVPLVVHVPSKPTLARWLQMALATVAGLIPVGAAIWYTMQQTADSGGY
jgi:hypothetical protein